MNESVSNNCQQHYEMERLAFLFLPVIAFCLNFLLFLTTTLNRRKLERQNYVYMCVISTLLSNMFFILLQVWYTFDTYFVPSDRSKYSDKTIWTLCLAAIVSIQLGMAGNIGSLIFVLLDSTYFVGRSVNKKASEFVKDWKAENDNNGKRRSFLNSKRRRAILLIILSWIFPISLIIAATAKWNCDSDCQFCDHGFAKDLHCNESSWCSRIWPPLRNDFLSLHAILWLFEVFGLVGLIISGIHSFHQVMSPPRRTSASGSLDNYTSDSKDERSLNKTEEITVVSASANLNSNFNNSSNPTSDSMKKKESLTGSKIELNGASVRHSRHKSGFRLHSRIIFTIILSTTFFVCTLPSFITYILDIIGLVVHYEVAMFVSFIAVYLYVIACPIILLKYLPNLQSAVLALFRSCSVSRIPGLQRHHSINNTVKNP